MSCKHGNHDRGCDLCDAEEAAYSRGYKDGLSESSQPSAASGRELPPTEKEWVPDLNFAADGWANVAYNGLQHLRNIQDGIGSLEAAIENMEKCCADAQVTWKQAQAAALSAAPADANVGGPKLILPHERGYEDDVVVRDNSGRTAYIAGWNACRGTMLGDFPSPTAPEPSAPADKVDAERYRKLMREVNDGFWGIAEFIVVDRLGATDPLWMDDKAMADAAIDKLPSDAAIARMRSESGQGGKL